jgi:serine/threonine protein kinase
LPLSQEIEVDLTIEGKLSFLNCNASIAFARECLRLDPKRRPSCDELMAHEYFNEFREWFEDEIQTLIEYDNQEAQQVLNGLGRLSFNRANVNITGGSLLSQQQHNMSRQQINTYQQ